MAEPSTRTWLRHPPATIRPEPCPTGLPEFASRALAAAAALGFVCDAGLEPAPCGAHWHLVAPTDEDRPTTGHER